ncbi:glucose-specific PTS transporter subunit IIBC [Staphylococcus massiliensis]|uniref:glucose-specific PTS transporter subunit IIBC n=1 Tax=Staphylococcus massiliensis TaxID=555791 RepID=UPI001EDE2605|nr:glucose-specific PTS transporter subunit IIBC [Staphylococcus massiliensis]MCG3398633.1 glucose-specific PTS transporter subunit IIBC [Staphylococcus massiliensis]
MWKKAFALLQRIGKALMLPVAILPAAGILLALGNALHNPKLVNIMPWLENDIVLMISSIMESAGDIIFSNLPLLFAIGTAIGLAGGDGVAALAAVIGYLIMNITISKILGITIDDIFSYPEGQETLNQGNKPQSYALVLGIPTLQSGVFGGIIMGSLAAWCYNKYYNIELPPFLGFFSGKRFVPIITSVVAILVGITLSFVWPPIQSGLNGLSNFLIDKNLTLTTLVFGIIERSLIPFGLHHIFYAPFWFEFGEYTTKAGNVVHGDTAIWQAQSKDMVEFTAGAFMTGKYPFMIFGLPAAAYAMYRQARPERKKVVGGLMLSAGLTAFLTGITEPIEFTFLFVAPILYGIHVLLAGSSFLIMHLLDVKIGMTFSGGLIDYILYGLLTFDRSNALYVIPVGLCYSVIYYFVFTFAIKKFNLKTPGREDDSGSSSNAKINDLPFKILTALGGKTNIVHLDACISRLRVEVKDKPSVNVQALKDLGASGVLEVGNSMQAIFGTKSDQLKHDIAEIIAGRITSPEETAVTDDDEATYITDKTEVMSPIEGQIVPLSDVPDQVFSDKLMGEGIAIKPITGEVVAPFNGTVELVFPTKHAIGLKSDNGVELLIHFGLETVQLEGKGFEVLVEAGSKVEVGTPLLRVDLEYIREHAKSDITPIIFTNSSERKIETTSAKEIEKGAYLMSIE